MIKFIGVSAVAVAFCVFACAGPAAETRKMLPGSDRNVTDAIASSDLIFLGTIARIEPPAPTAPAQATYPCVFNLGNDMLKGRVDEKKLTVFVTVRSVGEVHEVPPEVNRSYIVFVKGFGKQLSVLKLMDANDKSIHDIRRALGLERSAKGATEPSPTESHQY